jgi:hypothetical protein
MTPFFRGSPSVRPFFISHRFEINSIQTAIKYPELDVSARLTIWQKFFELAGCPLWGSEAEEFVNVDGKEPRCYVSLSDLELLAQKPFNGQHSLAILPVRIKCIFQDVPSRTLSGPPRR